MFMLVGILIPAIELYGPLTVSPRSGKMGHSMAARLQLE